MCTRSSLSHKYNSRLSCSHVVMSMLTLQRDCTINYTVNYMQAAIVLFMAFHLQLLQSTVVVYAFFLAIS